MSLDPVIGTLLVGAFALLFASASLHKWRDLPRFVEIFDAYAILPRTLLPLTFIVPLLESTVGLGLLAPPTRRLAGVTGALVLLAYAAAMAVNLRRGRRDIACGCGGPDERRPIAAYMVWRNGLLALLLAGTSLPWSSRTLQGMDWLTILFGITAAAVIYGCLDRLGAVMRQSRGLRGLS